MLSVCDFATSRDCLAVGSGYVESHERQRRRLAKPRAEASPARPARLSSRHGQDIFGFPQKRTSAPIEARDVRASRSDGMKARDSARGPERQATCRRGSRPCWPARAPTRSSRGSPDRLLHVEREVPHVGHWGARIRARPGNWPFLLDRRVGPLQHLPPQRRRCTQEFRGPEAVVQWSVVSGRCLRRPGREDAAKDDTGWPARESTGSRRQSGPVLRTRAAVLGKVIESCRSRRVKRRRIGRADTPRTDLRAGASWILRRDQAPSSSRAKRRPGGWTDRHAASHAGSAAQ